MVHLSSRIEFIEAYLKQNATPHNGLGCSDDQNLHELAILIDQIKQQQEQIKELERLARTDELTGLLNRRGFREALERHLQQNHEPGLLIQIDLDGFKAVNDTFGHAAGDAILVQVATLIRANIREDDAAGRLGGDEFAVLMPRLAQNQVWTRFRQLQHMLNHTGAIWNGQLIPLRASLGTRAIDGSDTLESLLIKADQAMYAVKAKRKQESAVA